VKHDGLFQRITRTFRREPKLHPIERQLAKRWIKQRLLAVFPELRGNPEALERAYHSLGLEPRPETHDGEEQTIFEMSAHWLP
jgi:hypothetical protein